MSELTPIERFNKIGTAIVYAYQTGEYARMPVADLENLLHVFMQMGRSAGLTDAMIQHALAEALRR